MKGWDPIANARTILGQTIDAHHTNHGAVRPYERERLIDLAVINWSGQTTAGAAAEAAIRTIKAGL